MTPAAECLIDARQMTFLSPLDIAGIAVLAVRQRGVGRRRLLLPDDEGITSYMERMNLLAYLDTLCDVIGERSSQPRHDRSVSLLELTRIARVDDAERVSEGLAKLAAARFDQRLASTVFRTVGELVDNAISHGGGPSGAFVAAQTYTGETSAHPGLEVAVCDTGIGVLSHLTSNSRYRQITRAETALKWALKEGVTGVDPAEQEGRRRGYGLPEVLQLAGRDGFAHLVLRSDDGLAQIDISGRVTQPSFQSCRAKVPGTWAWLRVNLPTTR